MTKEVVETCKVCGHSSTLRVMKLGHRETDSIQCPKCNETLIAWKKEPVSYFLLSNK